MASLPIRTLAVVVALLLAVGCSSDDDAADEPDATTESSTDTAPSPLGGDQLAEWADRGPHGVGSLQLDLDGRRTVVWYPAEAGAGTEGPTETFDIVGLLTPELQAQVPAELRPQHPIAARPGAAPAPGEGPYPVVLFSHGFAGFPEQSAHLTTHLASWGYVVAATDHVERSLSGLLGGAAEAVSPSTDPEVLAALLDLVVAQGADPASPLSEMVDPDAVVAAGHSAGARAAYQAAATDDRVDAFISYSVGPGDDPGGLGPVPAVPGLVMLGELDATIEPSETRAVYDGMGPPRYLLEVARSGHLVFSDVCLIGAEDGGVVAIVEAIDLDVPPELLGLASDGCQADALPVEEAFPAIDGVSVAFLEATVGADADAAAALEPDALEALGPDVPATLTADP